MPVVFSIKIFKAVTGFIINEDFSSSSQYSFHRPTMKTFVPRQANLVLIAYASSEGSGKPAHPHCLARTSTARSYKQ